jgi:hypothetical protein
LTQQLTASIEEIRRRLQTTALVCVIAHAAAGKSEAQPAPGGAESGVIFLQGRSLMESWNLVTTPFLAVVDIDGALAWSQEGWGPEIRGELERCLKREIAKAKK